MQPRGNDPFQRWVYRTWAAGGKRRWALLAGGGVSVLCMLCSCLVMFTPRNTAQVSTAQTTPVSSPNAIPQPTATVRASDTPVPSRTAAPSSTPRPTRTLAPTATPAPPTATLSPEDALRQAVLSVAPKPKDRPAPSITIDATGNYAVIEFAASDNLTANFIRKGMYLDMSQIVRAAFESGYPLEGVKVRASLPLVDQFGATTESNVGNVLITRAVFEKIQWATFDFNNIMLIGEEPFTHPALREQ